MDALSGVSLPMIGQPHQTCLEFVLGLKEKFSEDSTMLFKIVFEDLPLVVETRKHNNCLNVGYFLGRSNSSVVAFPSRQRIERVNK
jgi:hypothetical protein